MGEEAAWQDARLGAPARPRASGSGVLDDLQAEASRSPWHLKQRLREKGRLGERENWAKLCLFHFC